MEHRRRDWDAAFCFAFATLNNRQAAGSYKGLMIFLEFSTIPLHNLNRMACPWIHL
jgi:hypothetical protein